jgi:hypothetical protein
VNTKGSMLIQAMMITLLISLMASQLASNLQATSTAEGLRLREARFEAMGRYIATLGSDAALCIATFRIRANGTYVGGDTLDLDVSLPIEDSNANTLLDDWYPRAPGNEIAQFGDSEIFGLKVRNVRCPSSNCAPGAASLYSGDLYLVGRGANDMGNFNKNIGNMKFRTNAANQIASCFTIMTAEQFCPLIGGQFDDSAPIDESKCRFKVADIPPCSPPSNPTSFIADINPDGSPVCQTIAPCAPLADGTITYAVGLRDGALVCKPYPRPIQIVVAAATPTPTPTPTPACWPNGFNIEFLAAAPSGTIITGNCATTPLERHTKINYVIDPAICCSGSASYQATTACIDGDVDTFHVCGPTLAATPTPTPTAMPTPAPPGSCTKNGTTWADGQTSGGLWCSTGNTVFGLKCCSGTWLVGGAAAGCSQAGAPPAPAWWRNACVGVCSPQAMGTTCAAPNGTYQDVSLPGDIQDTGQCCVWPLSANIAGDACVVGVSPGINTTTARPPSCGNPLIVPQCEFRRYRCL